MKLAHLNKVVILMIIFILGSIQIVYAWPSVDTNGVAISTVANDQQTPQIVTDGEGGAIITWQDLRNGSDSDIYAQRIDYTGAVKWTTNGVAICTAENNQSNPQIVTDGQGGAIITWIDYRNGYENGIYAQRIDNTGAVKWTTDGVPISTVFGDKTTVQIITDGLGGAIMVWKKNFGLDWSIYAQAIDNTGAVKWTTDGVAICTTYGEKAFPQIVTDGNGGAIIAWQDRQNSSDWNIYAQAIDNTGAVKWTTDGVPICTTIGDQNSAQIVSDGNGGAIIAWNDYQGVFAQRIDNTGTVKWNTEGICISMAYNSLLSSMVSNDDYGAGAVIVWSDQRNTACNVYVQIIDNNGSNKWGYGLEICTTDTDAINPKITSFSSGFGNNYVITWQDHRKGTNWDIYAQVIDSYGTVKGTVNGVVICDAANDQTVPQIIAGWNQGAIITWQDYQNGTDWNINAAYLDTTTMVPVELSAFMTE